MKIADSVELEKATVELLENNFVRIIVKENAELNENDILKINDAKNAYVKQEPYVVLFVAPKTGNISRKARELAASEIVTKNAICKAIVANGKVGKIVGNFFVSFQKPNIPIKVFSNEESALEWIKKIKADK